MQDILEYVEHILHECEQPREFGAEEYQSGAHEGVREQM